MCALAHTHSHIHKVLYRNLQVTCETLQVSKTLMNNLKSSIEGFFWTLYGRRNLGIFRKTEYLGNYLRKTMEFPHNYLVYLLWTLIVFAPLNEIIWRAALGNQHFTGLVLRIAAAFLPLPPSTSNAFFSLLWSEQMRPSKHSLTYQNGNNSKALTTNKEKRSSGSQWHSIPKSVVAFPKFLLSQKC